MGLPDWLTQEDLNYVVSEFEFSGFRGGVNYYRNFHRNWEITEDLSDSKVEVPTLFLAGEQGRSHSWSYRRTTNRFNEKGCE